MDSPLITIYLTNYNYARYLQQAVESVLCQTFQDFELIIIDDGSKDNSREIIEQYRERPGVSIIYQQNRGLNATNNVAIQAAQGKYIMRLDADDFLEPSALGIMVALLEADEDLGLVFPDYYYVDEHGQRTGQERRHHFDDEVTLYDQPAHGACTMVRLAYLKALGGYDESFSCQDGYELWIKFIHFHKVTNISRPLFSYRRHSSNLTGNLERILTTRQRIKRSFVEQHLTAMPTLIIIPVRSNSFGEVNWPLHTYEGTSIVAQRVATCIACEAVVEVVVTAAEPELLSALQDELARQSKVRVMARPEHMAAPQVSLVETIELALSSSEAAAEAVGVVSVDFPFVDTATIREALDTLVLFKADSVISTLEDRSTFYQHTGKTLQAILDQDRLTRYERETLFRAVGGVVVTRIDSFQSRQQIIGERVAHIVLTPRAAFGVRDKFEFELFRSLISNQ